MLQHKQQLLVLCNLELLPARLQVDSKNIFRSHLPPVSRKKYFADIDVTRIAQRVIGAGFFQDRISTKMTRAKNHKNRM
jgi:hypothetical protein